MAKAYKIIQKKHPKFDTILNKDITTYSFVAKNDNSTGQKTMKLGNCVDANQTKIYTINKPVGIEKKENTEQLKKIKYIKQSWEAKRDSLESPLTWNMLIDGIKETRKKRDNTKAIFYDMIDDLWGVLALNDREQFKVVIKEHFEELKTCSLVEAVSEHMAEKWVKILDKMKIGEIKSSRTGKGFAHDTLVKRFHWFHKLCVELQKRKYVKEIHTDGIRPSWLNTKQSKKLKGKATNEEIEKIIKAKDKFSHYMWSDIWNAWVFSAIYTGMRFTTMAHLKWGDMKEKGKYMVFYLGSQQKVEVDLELYVKIDNLFKELVGDRKASDQNVFHLPMRRNKVNQDEIDSTLVSHYFKTLREKAGIDNDKLTAKLCRHTHAYRLLKATKSDIYRVAMQLGHKSIQTTKDNYVRHGDDFYKKTAKAINSKNNFKF